MAMSDTQERPLGAYEQYAKDRLAELPPAVAEAKPASVLLARRSAQYADDQRLPMATRLVAREDMYSILADLADLADDDDDLGSLVVVT